MAIQRMRQLAGKSGSVLRKRPGRKPSLNKVDRKLEQLEDRAMMASPQLVGIQTNDGQLLNLPPALQSVRHVAPQHLTLFFDQGQQIDPNTLATGIRIVRGGPDDVLGNANDVVVAPGFIGVGESPNTVIVRFAETLPDDVYRVEIIGAGAGALRNTLGEAFNFGVNRNVDFRLNLGAQIIAIVPQPITRGAGNVLTQRRDQIVVYFNDDDLHPSAVNSNSPNAPSVVRRDFYQLIFTNNSATNVDDQVYRPILVEYDPAADTATLTFSQAIDQLPTGPGTYRLRIGTNEAAPPIPVVIDVQGDPGSSFATARSLAGQFDTSAVIHVTGPGSSINDGQTLTITDDQNVTVVFEFDNNGVRTNPNNTPITFTAAMTDQQVAQAITTAINNHAFTVQAVRSGSRVGLTRDNAVSLAATATGVVIDRSTSVVLRSEIRSPNFPLDFPGGNDEPGHRNVSHQSHLLPADPLNPAYPTNHADPHAGPATFAYNFQNIYGADPVSGAPLQNLITEQQKNRAREVFELFSHYYGVQFFETANSGITIATGDLRAVNPLAPTGRGGLLSLSLPGQLVVLDAAELWHDQFGLPANAAFESWFRTAMHEIGRAIGLGDTDELPQITTGTTEPETYPTFGTTPEAAFPGDHDIVHGQHRYRPDSTDIDMYRFTIEAFGTFTAETFAERLNGANPADSSLLDSVLTLWREHPNGSRELLSRNDDYFSEDSFISMNLGPGTYYIGVSASGNSMYNPNVPDSGIGGTSEGPYELRLNFRPDAFNAIVDADVHNGRSDAQPLDGDNDGVPGGVHNFWFRVQTPQRTLIVDKASTAPAETGALTSPFRNIPQAFAVAQPGDVVRIVGNGGADNNFNTLTDNQPYVVGLNPVTGVPLADGANIRVPRGVTMMIDAGAIFKMRRSTISVGSSAPEVDRSDGALQVLGIPTRPVFFTSYDDETIGTDTNPLVAQTPAPGQWGGLVFAQDIDRAEANNRPAYIDFEKQGIFLNYVNHADIRYGGGLVQVDSVERVFNPVDMTDSRPTISYNTITLSGDAAISANPDSFLESNFHDPITQSLVGRFTTDYDRVGPAIYGNKLVARRLNAQGVPVVHQNTLNGLFIRIPTDAGRPLETLTVTGRWDDTDIVHIVSENLIIDSTPGGPLGTALVVAPNTPPVDAFQLTPRLDAQLVIDPGIVVKLDGSRIEVARSAQLIAEGQAGREIIFTSLADRRHGAGGTFDTSSSGGSFNDPPTPGDWGGLYVSNVAKASLDHVVVAYAGGITRVEGGFAAFNPLEIHQADVRVANSLFEFNGDGTKVIGPFDDPERVGRGRNSDAVIFIRSAQPIIINNTIRNSVSTNDAGQAAPSPVPAISANANALNWRLVTDHGRSTGQVDIGFEFGDQQGPIGRGNYGPLIRKNVLENNELNGLLVRGGVMTTEGVWDDTDIVHILQDTVFIPDFHTYGGVRLQSNSAESLVVKLLGPTAGFTTFGRPLDIIDRIGGMLHVIGQPQRPVILTSLHDDTVGAGRKSDGTVQKDTNNNGAATQPQPGDWRGILLTQYTHDRNVAVVVENELPNAGAPGLNATPDNAQFLGQLAAREMASDDNLRLGFTVHGVLSAPNDLDVYSFRGSPGTEVWLDIDRTTSSLDTIVELINADGEVLARSANSFDEHNQLASIFTRPGTVANVLQNSVFYPKDHWSTNPKDAGMRVVLPGTPGGPVQTYHVRVRSGSPNVATQLLGGQTAGVYQLQIRLREVDEFAGTSVRNADIRYATNAIDVRGMPGHSPLLGEIAEIENNNTRQTAQPIGNLLQSDRAAISVAGALGGANDVDWYRLDLNYDSPLGGGTHAGVLFDLDYADGMARANTFLSVFDAAGRLVLTSRDSNVTDDRPGPLSTGGDAAEMSRGSVGPLDPFLGTIQLPVGTYFVAVSSNRQIPNDLQQFFLRNPANPLARLEPLDSIVRVAEDHISFVGGSTADAPQTLNLFDYTYRLEVLRAADIRDGETFSIVDALPLATAGQNNVLRFRADDLAHFEFDSDGIINNPGYNVISLVDFFGDPLSEEDLAQAILTALQFAITVDGGFLAAAPSINPAVNPRLVNLGNAVWVEQSPAPNVAFAGLAIRDPSATPFRLADVPLYITNPVGVIGAQFRLVDPFTGAVETMVGTAGFDIGDLMIRQDGGMYALSLGLDYQGGPTDANSGNFLKINPGTGAAQVLRDDGILTYVADANGNPVRANNNNGVGIQFNAATFGSTFGPQGTVRLYAVGNRAGGGPGVAYTRNVLYLLDGDEWDGNGVAPGVALNNDGQPKINRAATNAIDIGTIETTIDAFGNANSVLLAIDATRVIFVNNQSQTIFDINDGDSFNVTLDDGTFLGVFEMDAGAEVRINYDINQGQFFSDGQFFTLSDGVVTRRLEFDTGAVLVPQTFPIGQLQAGDSITITDNAANPTTLTFVMDDINDLTPVNPPNIAVPFDSRPIVGTTPAQFVTALVNAINSANFNVQATVVNGRIQLTSDTNVVTSPGFVGLTQFGNTGVTPGSFRIPIEEFWTPDQVRQQIVTVVNGIPNSPQFPGVPEFTASTEGVRVNFVDDLVAPFLPVTGNFAGAPLMANSGSTGGAAPGNFAIPFLAADSGEEIAARIAAAVNATLNRGQPTNPINPAGVLATNTPPSRTVSFTYDQNPGGPVFPVPLVNVNLPGGSPFSNGAPAPGGDVTGAALIGGELYVVTNAGGLFRIPNPNTPRPTGPGGVALINADYIETATQLVGLNFSGLTAGPPNVEGGKYANMLFGITTGGTLYAFNTDGTLQPVFAGGATSVATGVFGANGLAFSTLDYNLWHRTFDLRQNDPGHGMNATVTQSRGNVPGGASLYFGNELPTFSDVSRFGQESTSNYYFPGGSHGSIVSNPFSLKDYTAQDLPTLYFNYLLDIDGIDFISNVQHQRDVLRVFVAADDSVDGDRGDWHLVATNDEFRGPNPNDDEYDWGLLTGFNIQTLFENTGWRQARVDLSPYAGRENIRLRFDFSTAGGMNLGSAYVGEELSARAGNMLLDGQFFQVFDNRTFQVNTFEFDLGYTLVPPSGAELRDRETFRLTDSTGVNPPLAFEFDKDNYFFHNIVTVDGAQLIDGQTFAIDKGGVVTTFEFDAGFSLQVPPTGGLSEGDTFSIRTSLGALPVVFEFDTNGSVAPGNRLIPLIENYRIIAPTFGGGPNGIQDGQTFIINDGFGGPDTVFEFDKNNQVTPGNIPVGITNFSTANVVADAIVAAVVGAGIGLTAQNIGGGVVQLGGGPNYVDSSGTPTLTLGGTVASQDLVANYVAQAIDLAALGLTPVNVGAGLVNLGGSTHIIDVAGAPNLAVVGAPGLATPGSIGIAFSPSAASTADDIALLIAAAINGANIGVTATANGDVVELSGVNVDTSFSPGDTLLTPQGVTPIRIADNDSAGAIAQRIAAAILNSGLEIIPRVHGNRVNLTDASNVTQNTFQGENRPGLFVDGSPGTLGGIAVPIHADMTAAQVAEQIARVMNQVMAPAADAAGVSVTFRYDNVVRVMNGQVTNPGPLGFDNFLEGDYTPPLPIPEQVHGWGDFLPNGPALRVLNNGGPYDTVNRQGAFVDDIIIGFAERGEMVTGTAPSATATYVNNPASPAIDIVTGEYQLEIRRASEYGVPTPTGLGLVRSFDTNDRLANSVTVFAPQGSDIAPGDSFTISDGRRTATFQYVDQTLREGNDTIDTAEDTGIRPGGGQYFVGFGSIGANNGKSGDNNNPLQGLDVDLLRMELTAGSIVSFDVDAILNGSAVRTYLRIFDAAGNEVANSAVNADAPGEIPTLDPFIRFVVPTTGVYYLGVSGVHTILGPNNDYSPFLEGSGTIAANTSGFYQLEITVGNFVPQFTGIVPLGFATFDTDRSIAARIAAAINSPIVQQTLGLAVRASHNTLSNRVDLNGTAVVVDDRLSAIPETFTENNDTIFNATVTGITPGGQNRYYARGVLGDNPNLLYDPFNPAVEVDMFSFVAAAGDRVTIDIDALDGDIRTGALNLTTTRFDSLLRLFTLDAAGNVVELASTDDSGAPGEYTYRDSYLEFIAPADGVYYIGVSSWDNPFYDPTLEGSGANFAGGTTGPYELTVRVGGPTTHGITQQVFYELGDRNLFRDQGQLLLQDNRISHSSQFGIRVEAGTRDGAGNAPHPGAPRNTQELNQTNRFAPGVTIVNNIVHRNTQGAIRFAGDPNPVGSPAVPFGRIINNTLYGNGPTGGGVGIQVANNASPTILNNIIANFATGISVDASSNTTVIGTSLYQNNGAHVTPAGFGLGQFPITLAAGEPLFVNAATGNFYPAAGSRAIDSSLDSLPDRPDLVRVRSPLGIAVSPILAPARDNFGQLRVDDPNVEPPNGFGSQVFKDRGAVDRADFTGPRASLVDPLDNDAEGKDQNRSLGIVETTGDAITRLVVSLVDGAGPSDPSNGSGIDHARVTAATVVLTYSGAQGGAKTPLTLGIDYVFAYDDVNASIVLTPVAGVFTPGEYVITLDNSVADGVYIADLAGNPLQANQADGTVQFIVRIADNLDFGDLPAPYPTTLAQNGPRHRIQPGYHLGARIDAELDGRPSQDATGDDGIFPAFDDEDGVRLLTPLTAGGNIRFSVVASAPGYLNAWFDWNRDGDFNDPGEQIFSTLGRPLVAGTNIIEIMAPITLTLGNVYARFRFSSAGGLSPTGEAPDGEVEDYRFTVSPPGFQNPTNRFDVDNSGFISNNDALLIISALRASNGPFALPNPPAPPFVPPPFLDVDGNNFVTVNDALLVIQILLQQRAGGEAAGESALVGEGELAAAGWVDTSLATGLETPVDVGSSALLTTSSTLDVAGDEQYLFADDSSLISQLTTARRQPTDGALAAAVAADTLAGDDAYDLLADDLAALWGADGSWS